MHSLIYRTRVIVKNKSPIFLFCFSRGGSNIFWNIFLSHPDACSPIFETLEIFRTGVRNPTWAGYRIAILSGQPRLFDQWKLTQRKSIAIHIQHFIDKTLYGLKLTTFTNEAMKYKYENEKYSLQEIETARLVTKNNNGLAFLSDIYLNMYQDATFFGLVRDPIALYESHLRHKITKSPEAFARYYNCLAGRMLADAARLKNYHLVKFEDILANPVSMIQKLYSLAKLDIHQLKKIRFRAKPHFMANGAHDTKYTAFRHYWFDLENMYDILEPNINRYQINRLEANQQKRVAELTEKTRHKLGYA